MACGEVITRPHLGPTLLIVRCGDQDMLFEVTASGLWLRGRSRRRRSHPLVSLSSHLLAQHAAVIGARFTPSYNVPPDPLLRQGPEVCRCFGRACINCCSHPPSSLHPAAGTLGLCDMALAFCSSMFSAQFSAASGLRAESRGLRPVPVLRRLDSQTMPGTA